MEERILDEDEGRGIRIKRTADGETDAVEGTAAEEEEVAFDFPEEYDESLAGMTQAQVEEELARREKAKQQALETYRKLTDEGNALLAEEKFAEAEEKFAEAVMYETENDEAVSGLFAAATENFTDAERLYTEERAGDIDRFETGRKILREKFGEKLSEERRIYDEEIARLKPAVEAKRAERREAFASNKKHYIIWTSISLFLAAVFAIATAISADNILKTSDGTLPIAFTVTFGVLTFVSVTMLAVFGVQLIGANRLCRMNEKPGSAKDGERLLMLERRAEILNTVLGTPEDADNSEKTEV